MTDGIARRRFLTQLTRALSVTATSGPLVWWTSAAAAPPQRKTPSGDLLETVPQSLALHSSSDFPGLKRF
jgi:hypothetical protein